MPRQLPYREASKLRTTSLKRLKRQHRHQRLKVLDVSIQELRHPTLVQEELRPLENSFLIENIFEKIGKLTTSDINETKMRILTMEAAGELQGLLHHIGTLDKVVGSVIVGHDGLLIANTMPPDLDAESIGVWALGVYMNTEHVVKKMGQD